MTEENEQIRRLPQGWIQLKLEDVADWGSGATQSRKNADYFNGDIPWIKTGELKSKYIFNTEEKITKEAVIESSTKIFPKGSVAIAMYGATIGKTSILNIDAATNQACAVAKPLREILFNEFLYYYLSSQGRKFTELGKGGAQPNISQTILKNYPIFLPPLSEQQHIVEKIEELFSDIDQGIESLKTAQKQLKVYRQAVLKWAFEGKLTEEWRRDRFLYLKTGEALLAQIKTERENHYQQQLAEWEAAVKKWEAKGKVGKKPTKPQKLKELLPLTEAELSELPQFPSCWHLEKLGNLSELVGGVTKGRDLKAQTTISLAYLRVANVQDGYLDLSLIKYIEVLPSELDKYRLIAGDVLYTEGGDKDKLGRGTVWQEEIKDCIHQNHVFRARLLSPSVIPDFIAYYSQTQTAKNYFFKRAKQTVNLASINMTILSNLSIPIPSYLEQEQIVQEIELRLSICDQLEATIVENLQKAEALRQSILKQAFEGKLVPQDPNDEPAEKLLERIKQEKINQKAELKQNITQLKIEGIPS